MVGVYFQTARQPSQCYIYHDRILDFASCTNTRLTTTDMAGLPPNLNVTRTGVSDARRVPSSSSRSTKDFLAVDCSSYKHVTMNWLALLLGIKGCACAAETRRDL